MADNLNVSELTENQQLAVQQYTAVTNQELKDALPLLRRCEFNVQIAIARFFDGESTVVDDVPPPVASTRTTRVLAHDLAPRSSSLRRPQHKYETALRVAALPDSQRIRQAPLLLLLIMTPLSMVCSILSRTLGLGPAFLRFRERFLSRILPSSLLRTSNSRRQLGSQDTATRFQREFEEIYGPAPLPFLRMGYGQAFDTAKRELKFLVVVPIAPEHDDTEHFVRQVLLSEIAVSFFIEHSSNILLWAGSVEDSEPFEVANSLRLTRFPATAVVAHTPSVSSMAMSVLKRIVAPASPQDYVAQIQAIVTQHEQELGRVRATRQEQQASRSIREQQNSAYERSLATDRERRRQREQAEEAARIEAEAETRRLEQAALLEQNRTAWRRWRLGSIKPEPSADEGEAVRVSLRLPQGSRIVRRFGPADTMDDLYAFVDCNARIEDDSEESERPGQPPPDYTHQYDFQLVSTLPREVHACSSVDTIRERLGRSSNLIVELLGQNDEEDSTVS